MKRYQSKETYARLAARIESILQQRSLTILELAVECDCSESAVRTRLLDMQAEGRAHFVELRTKGNLGNSHLWTHGPIGATPTPPRKRPAGDGAPKRTSTSIGVPSQVSTRDYPRMSIRDPLVAALFGPGPVAAA